MADASIELLAAYFTLAGDVYPFGPTEVSPFPFKMRVEAAARAGWKGMGFTHADIRATEARIGYREMKRILDNNGIKHVELEFVVDWFLDGPRRKKSDKVRHEILAMAQALGARDVKIGPGLGEDIAHPRPEEMRADIPRMTEAFIGICRDAAKHGTAVVMEIMPFGNVNTIATGRAIVEGADQPNGGLLIDIWHIARGGNDYADIAKIPARFIGSVELDDAEMQMRGTLWDDTIFRRRLPGEGELDPVAFIKSVRAAGYHGPWGVEILSETFRKLPLATMAKRAFDTSMAALKA